MAAVTADYGSSVLTPQQRQQQHQRSSGGRLEEYFYNALKPFQLQKWHHYFHVYKCYLGCLVGTLPAFMEVGVAYGGSLRMWEHYFGPGCSTHGVDCNT